TACQANSVVLPDGRFLLGCGPGYLFDPTSGQVQPLEATAERQRLGTRLADGRLLYTDATGNAPLVFVPAGYVPGEQLPWVTTGGGALNDLIQARYGGSTSQALTPLPDGRTLVLATRPNETNHPLQLGLALVFDPALVTFTQVTSPTGRFANTATLLQD